MDVNQIKTISVEVHCVLKEPNPFKSPLRSQGHYCKWGPLHFVMAPWLQSATNPQTMARLAKPWLN
jgi:hypothetical protein